jgi:hypothetical protein
VGPVVSRAQRSGRLPSDVTADEIAAFMRMIGSSPTPSLRRRAAEILLDGLAQYVGET